MRKTLGCNSGLHLTKVIALDLLEGRVNFPQPGILMGAFALLLCGVVSEGVRLYLFYKLGILKLMD